MEFNELFEKYINDDSFKVEAESIYDENLYKEFAKKNDIPYSLEELKILISDQVEKANCPRRYSEKTYSDLNCNHTQDQLDTNHPLIVTWGNKCKLGSKGTCFDCVNSACLGPGLVTYCKGRSKEFDACA